MTCNQGEDHGLIGKLRAVGRRFEEIDKAMADPETFKDPGKYRELAKERAGIAGTVERFARYSKVLEDIKGCRELLDTETEPDMRTLAEEDLTKLEEEKDILEEELKRALIPKDPYDDKNVIVEIRAGTGGDEAALFAADLFRMYGRYAEEKGWKLEVLTGSPTDIGGMKEIVFSVEGHNVYGRLKYEGGVHRVQRIPVTESSGRLHTSTATVAVLPEPEEVEIDVNPDDLRVDTYCSSGKGGQGVNTTYSAVRITHLPTGTVATCQDERSQIQNRERAMRILRSRLLALAQDEKQHEMTMSRRSQVGTGERAEKIRTYNFPQNRVTEHRLGFTTHRLAEFLDGDIDEVVDLLILDDENKKLQEAQ